MILELSRPAGADGAPHGRSESGRIWRRASPGVWRPLLRLGESECPRCRGLTMARVCPVCEDVGFVDRAGQPPADLRPFRGWEVAA